MPASEIISTQPAKISRKKTFSIDPRLEIRHALLNEQAVYRMIDECIVPLLLEKFFSDGKISSKLGDGQHNEIHG
jgi:hypothetical protein